MSILLFTLFVFVGSFGAGFLGALTGLGGGIVIFVLALEMIYTGLKGLL